MNLSRKKLLFFKDFIALTFIFYIVSLTPLGSLGWRFGVFEEYKFNEILYEAKKSSIAILALMYYFLLYYLGSVFFSVVPVILNIYFVRINKFRQSEYDYNILKVLFMFITNLIYLLGWMVFYSELMYRDFLFPLVITLIIYLLWVYGFESFFCESNN